MGFGKYRHSVKITAQTYQHETTPADPTKSALGELQQSITFEISRYTHFPNRTKPNASGKEVVH